MLSKQKSETKWFIINKMIDEEKRERAGER
jgi:hypothetical protein